MEIEKIRGIYSRKCPFSSVFIGYSGEEESSDHAAGLEEAIHGGDEIRAIASGCKFEVFDE